MLKVAESLVVMRWILLLPEDGDYDRDPDSTASRRGMTPLSSHSRLLQDKYLQENQTLSDRYSIFPFGYRELYQLASLARWFAVWSRRDVRALLSMIRIRHPSLCQGPDPFGGDRRTCGVLDTIFVNLLSISSVFPLI